MYSREESKKIRQEFWISFGKNYPRKWLLYNTRIKDLSLKFDFTRKYAEVAIESTSSDEVFREYYYEKIQSLQSILKEDFLPEIMFDKEYELENGKVISRAFLQRENVNIHNKNDWPRVQEWLASKMDLLESFFIEYRDFIDQ
ncbi:DUF4268 domain-containing protein [Salinimicrobium sp. GXAS 041]|uniref:DUF4268 domain-containing protein n=1 Tax=Salinimicrobium sp. GXAS 041 TaxID=3400806 RepID=UPI003C76061C